MFKQEAWRHHGLKDVEVGRKPRLLIVDQAGASELKGTEEWTNAGLCQNMLIFSIGGWRETAQQAT